MDLLDHQINRRIMMGNGGTRISIGQCKNDKEAILTTIGEIRAYQLGLIQQLIELLTFNKNNQC